MKSIMNLILITMFVTIFAVTNIVAISEVLSLQREDQIIMACGAGMFAGAIGQVVLLISLIKTYKNY